MSSPRRVHQALEDNAHRRHKTHKSHHHSSAGGRHKKANKESAAKVAPDRDEQPFKIKPKKETISGFKKLIGVYPNVDAALEELTAAMRMVRDEQDDQHSTPGSEGNTDRPFKNNKYKYTKLAETDTSSEETTIKQKRR